MYFFISNNENRNEYIVNNNNDNLGVNLKIPSQAMKQSLKFCIPTYKIDQSFISGAFFDKYYLPHLTFVSDIFYGCPVINTSKVNKKLLITDKNKFDYFFENNNNEIIWNEDNGIEETLDPFNQLYRGLNTNQKKNKIEQETPYFDLITKSKILGDIIFKALKEKNNLDLLPSTYKSLLRNKTEYEKMFQSKFKDDNNNQHTYGERTLTSNLTFSSDLRLKELVQSSNFNTGRGIVIAILIENVILSCLLLRRSLILSPALSLLIYGDPSCGKSHLCEVSKHCVIIDLVEYISQTSTLGNTSFKTDRCAIFNDDCPNHALPHDTPQTGKLSSEKKQYLEKLNGLNTYDTIAFDEETKKRCNKKYRFEVTTSYVSLSNNALRKLYIEQNLDPISQAILDRQIKINLFKPSQLQTILMKNIESRMKENINDDQIIDGNNNSNNEEENKAQIFLSYDLYRSKSIIRSACIYIYFSNVSQNTLPDIDMNIFDFLSKTIETSIHRFFPNTLNERKIKRIESFCKITIIKDAFEIVFRHLRNEVKSIDEIVNLMKYFVFCNTETVLWSFFFIVNELLTLPLTKFLKDCQENTNINFYRYDKDIFKDINLLDGSEESEKLKDFLTEFVLDDDNHIIYVSEPNEEIKKNNIDGLTNLMWLHYKRKQDMIKSGPLINMFNINSNNNNNHNNINNKKYDIVKNMMTKRTNESKAIKLKNQISYCRMDHDEEEEEEEEEEEDEHQNGPYSDKELRDFITFKCLDIDLSGYTISRFKMEDMGNDEVYLNLNYIEFRIDELKRLENGILQDVVNLRRKTQVINFIPLIPISAKFEWIQENKKFLYSLIHNPKYLSKFPTTEVPVCITKESNLSYQYLPTSITKFYVLLQYINLNIKDFASIICDSVSYHSTIESTIITPFKTSNEKERDFIQVQLRKKKGKILSRNTNQKINDKLYGHENENEKYNQSTNCYMKFLPTYFKNSNIDQEGKKNFYHNNFGKNDKKYENIEEFIDRSHKNSMSFLESTAETSLLNPKNTTDYVSKKISNNVSIKNKIIMLKKNNNNNNNNNNNININNNNNTHNNNNNNININNINNTHNNNNNNNNININNNNNTHNNNNNNNNTSNKKDKDEYEFNDESISSDDSYEIPMYNACNEKEDEEDLNTIDNNVNHENKNKKRKPKKNNKKKKRRRIM